MLEVSTNQLISASKDVLLEPDTRLLQSAGKQYSVGTIFDQPIDGHVYHLAAANGHERNDPRSREIRAVLRMCADGRFNVGTYRQIANVYGLNPGEIALFSLASGASQVGERRVLAARQVEYLTDHRIFPNVSMFIDVSHLNGCAGFCRDVGRADHLHKRLTESEAESIGVSQDDELGIEERLHLLTMRANRRRIVEFVERRGVSYFAYVARIEAEGKVALKTVKPNDYEALVADEMLPQELRRLVD